MATAWRYVTETVALLAARAPKIAPGTDGCHQGRTRLRGDRRHVNPHRPGCCRPAVLLRQAPPPRHEPAGHLCPCRRDPVGLRPAARRRARPDRRRIWGIIREPAAAGLITLADKGYHGAGQRSHGPLSCWLAYRH